jgi:hypothetical protein
MWGRKRGSDGNKSTKTPSAVTADPAPASILTPAKSKTEDAQKQTAESSSFEVKENAIKLAHLESELQSKTEEVEDLNSNLALAKESLR